MSPAALPALAAPVSEIDWKKVFAKLRKKVFCLCFVCFVWAVCVSNGGPCVSVRWLVEAVAVFAWMDGWMGWMDG